jgi:hypothetical protein
MKPEHFPKHLFPDFLEDPDHFRASREFWDRLCEKILQETGEPDEWKPWFSTEASHGNLIDDGSPIYSLITPNQGKGFSITQIPVEKKDEIHVYAYTRFYGESSPNGKVQHLVIGCELSEEAAEIVKDLLRYWIKPRTDIHLMSFFIDLQLAKLGL